MSKEFKTLLEKGIRKLRKEINKLRDNSELVEPGSDLFYEINALACKTINLQELLEMFTEEED